MTLLPNILSFLRIFLTPVFVYLLWHNSIMYALIVFTVAALTDTCDGYFARRYSAFTVWGAFLDPVADKILTISAFVCFVVKGIIAWWLVVIIILRDVLVTLLRSRAMQQGLDLKTTRLAQWKTVVQFVALYTAFLGLAVQGNKNIELFVAIVMYAVAGITVYTGLDYVFIYRKLQKRS